MATRLRSPFAFLGRSAAAEDDEKDDKNKSKSKAEEKDDDKDEDGDVKKKDKKDDDAKGKSKSKAEDGDDDDDGKKKKKPEDEDDDGNGGKSKSKKSKAKADDDEDDTSASAKVIRAQERSRIRAILVSEAGQADPVAAAHIALDTDMPRDQAVGMLAAMSVSRAASGGPTPARAGLGNRMSEVPNPTVGADGGSSTGPSMADQIVAAGKKRRGEG